MKIAGAIKNERRELRFVPEIKPLDLARRNGKAQVRSPIAQVEGRKLERFAVPGAVKIDMQADVQKI